MSSFHKDLSRFRTCAIRLELLLNGMQNAYEDRMKKINMEQMDAIQKDQIQFALSLLQEMRTELAKPAEHHYDSQKQENEEALLQKLTDQVQYYLNHIKSSIKDSLVEPKAKKIRLMDLIGQDEPIQDKATHSDQSKNQSSMSHHPSAHKSDTTTSTSSHQPPLPVKQKKLDIVKPSAADHIMEPEVVSHRLQQDIAHMAQQLKSSTLHIHKSLQHQNAQLYEMESLAQESVDKTKQVTDKVQDHVKKGWKQMFGRWFVFFIIVGSWFFCFLIIRSVPKRSRYDYSSSHDYRQNPRPLTTRKEVEEGHQRGTLASKECIHSKWICKIQSLVVSSPTITRNQHHPNTRDELSETTTTTTTKDDFVSSHQSSSSCSPPNSQESLLFEEPSSSSCVPPRNAFQEEITKSPLESSPQPVHEYDGTHKTRDHSYATITELGDIEGVHAAMDQVKRRKEERYARNLQKAMEGETLDILERMEGEEEEEDKQDEVDDVDNTTSEAENNGHDGKEPERERVPETWLDNVYNNEMDDDKTLSENEHVEMEDEDAHEWMENEDMEIDYDETDSEYDDYFYDDDNGQDYGTWSESEFYEDEEGREHETEEWKDWDDDQENEIDQRLSYKKDDEDKQDVETESESDLYDDGQEAYTESASSFDEDEGWADSESENDMRSYETEEASPERAKDEL